MAIGDKVYIADKPTLDVVDTKIGATTDTGGTTTAGGIFAKLNAILQQFLSNWTVARAEKIDTISSGVINLSNRGAVKSVQRGISRYTSLKKQKTYTININAVNMNKSILIMSKETRTNSEDPYDGCYCVLTSSTEITIHDSFYNSASGLYNFPDLAWQVIEFY